MVWSLQPHVIQAKVSFFTFYLYVFFCFFTFRSRISNSTYLHFTYVYTYIIIQDSTKPQNGCGWSYMYVHVPVRNLSTTAIFAEIKESQIIIAWMSPPTWWGKKMPNKGCWKFYLSNYDCVSRMSLYIKLYISYGKERPFSHLRSTHSFTFKVNLLHEESIYG